MAHRPSFNMSNLETCKRCNSFALEFGIPDIKA